MTVAARSGHYMDRPSSSGLIDVIDLILDKGLVIDIYVRVSLVGIEILTIDARIVVASVDTYLRFAEAVNRLDLKEDNSKGLPDLVGDLEQGGAKRKTRGALEGVKETVGSVIDKMRSDDEDEDDTQAEPARRPQRRSRSRNEERE